MGLCKATRGQCLALRATLPATWASLPATWMTLSSSVLAPPVYPMELFPVPCCLFALVGVGLGDKFGAECAHGVAETYPCVWNDECSLASVPPASASHDYDGLALQEECTANRAESDEANSSAIAFDCSDMPL